MRLHRATEREMPEGALMAATWDQDECVSFTDTSAVHLIKTQTDGESRYAGLDSTGTPKMVTPKLLELRCGRRMTTTDLDKLRQNALRNPSGCRECFYGVAS